MMIPDATPSAVSALAGRCEVKLAQPLKMTLDPRQKPTQVTAVGNVIESVDHGVRGGRYWDNATYYLYTMLWDPFLLARTRCLPSLCEGEEMKEKLTGDIVFFAKSSTSEDIAALSDMIKRGGKVVLNHPELQVLGQIGDLACVDRARPHVISLRERWDMGAMASRDYYYPDRQPYLRLDPERGEVFSEIGENPDLMVSDQVAVFAGNPFLVLQAYANVPGILSTLFGDLSGLFVEVVGQFIGQPLTPRDRANLPRAFQLRRDFHAFGYALMTVRELQRCLDGPTVALDQIEPIIIEAADALVNEDDEQAEKSLRHAFEKLAKENRKLQPTPAVFIDTLHGGELYPDVGYFEIDWPQHPVDVIRTYMDWMKNRSYRFNIDFGATTVRELATRYPKLFDELRECQDRQLVEWVNGSCNQPYPPFHSLESQIRQFDIGAQIWQRLFNRRPSTYASQEYGFCPQLASVLAQQGYHHAVIRVQNMGDAPTLRDEQIDWVAPNGDQIRSLPSHPHKSEQLNCYTYNNLHLKLYLHLRDHLDFAVFTCLGDVTFHRPMREDLVRVCHYAPVFGRFETFESYFAKSSPDQVAQKRLYMNDFLCDAGFINLETWPIYQDVTGNYNMNCMRSMAATSLFAAAELLDSMHTIISCKTPQMQDHDKNWEALSHYQGHGTYIVPWYPSGAFLGGCGSPRSKAAGRATQNVAEYLGPFDDRTVKDVTDRLMDQAEDRARTTLKRCLLATTTPGSSKHALVIYGFGPAAQRVVRLPHTSAKGFELAGDLLPIQQEGKDCLTLLSVPSYGHITVAVTKKTKTTVPIKQPSQAGHHYLENGRIHVEFDPDTAAITRFVRKSDGQNLLSNPSHMFYGPDRSTPRCRQVKVMLNGPLRASIEFVVEVPNKHNQPCILNVCAFLDVDQEIVDFETKVLQAPPLTGDQWANHLGVRFQFEDRYPAIFWSHFNVLEPCSHNKIYSPNVLLARSNGADIIFLNQGNQFYLKEDHTLSNILLVENEKANRFRYAVGISQANPIIQARIWAKPVFVQEITKDQCVTERIAGPSILSYLSLDSDDVEVLSCRYDETGMRVRLANTSAQPIIARLSTAFAISKATLTSLSGREQTALPLIDDAVAIRMRPWDIQQLLLIPSSPGGNTQAAGNRECRTPVTGR